MNLIQPVLSSTVMPKIYNKINYGLSFDGSDDYVDSGSILDNKPNLTISVWLYLIPELNDDGTLKGDFEVIFGTGLDSGYCLYFEKTADEYVRMSYRLHKTTTPYIGTPHIGKLYYHNWYYISVARDAHKVKIYINAKVAKEEEIDGEIGDSINTFQIGGVEDRTGYKLTGIVSSLEMYYKTLTQEQIKANMDKDCPTRFMRDMPLHYNFDTGRGSQVKNEARDSYHGTIIGATWEEVDNALS